MKKLILIFSILSILTSTFAVNMICGVSWFIDIIGGILIGSNLILLYSFPFDI